MRHRGIRALYLIMQPWPARFAAYNPLSCNTIDRANEIVTELNNFDCIGLSGTCLRKDPRETNFEQQLLEAKFRIIHSGYIPSKHSTTSCGVALALGKRFKNARIFGQNEMKGAYQGRAMTLRAKTGYFDFTFIVLYYPPPPLKGGAAATKVYLQT